MDKEKLKKKILETIKHYPIASVATIKDGKPWVRYMVVKADDNFVLWTATFKNSRKIEQIQENNNVHLTIGADPKDWFKSFLNYVGKAEIHSDPETKAKCWDKSLKKFFEGPEDPGYVVLKFIPETIEFMNNDSMRLEIYSVDENPV